MGWREARGYLVQQNGRQVIWIKRPGMPKPIPINRRVDLFGFADLVGLKPGAAVAIDQVSTATNRSHKHHQVEKALDPLLGDRRLGNESFVVFVWVWGKWADKGYGFSVEEYLGRHEWRDLAFVPSSEAPDRPARKKVPTTINNRNALPPDAMPLARTPDGEE